MSVSDDLNAFDRGFFLNWHARRRKHQGHMERAGIEVRLAAYLRDNGQAIPGWEAMRRAITEVVCCGCPPEMWPTPVKEAINP